MVTVSVLTIFVLSSTNGVSLVASLSTARLAPVQGPAPSLPILGVPPSVWTPTTTHATVVRGGGVLPSNSTQGVASTLETLNLWNNTLVQGNYAPQSGLQLSSLVDDSALHEMFIAASASDSVVEINSTTHAVKRYIAVGGDPDALALDDSNGDLYVSNGWTDNLTVINASSGQVVNSVRVGVSPDSLAFDPVNGLVYVGNMGCFPTPYNPCGWVGNVSNLSVVDPMTESVIGWISGQDFPSSLSFDPANGLLYVTSDGSNHTRIVDPNTESPSGWISTNKTSGDGVLDANAGMLYVTTGSGEIQAINLSKGIVVKNITAGLNAPTSITLDEATHTLYALNSNGTIESLSTNGSEEKSIHLGGVSGLFFSSDQGVLDALSFDNVDYLSPGLLSLNGSTTVGTGGTIMLGNGPGPPITSPDAVLFDSVSRIIMVANYYAGNVSLISAQTQRVVADVASSPSRQNPIALTLDPVTGVAYVLYYNDCCASGTLVAIDPSNGTVVASISVGSQPTDVVYDPESDVLYVANSGDHNVAIVTPHTNQITGTIATAGIPMQEAVDPNNGNLFVGEWGCASNPTCPSVVQVLDKSTQQFGAQVSVGEWPEGIAFDPWNSEVYVADSYSNNVTILSSTSESVIGSIPVGPSPYGICFDPLDGFLYVTDSEMYTYPLVGISYVATQGPDNLTEIDGLSNTGAGEILVGAGPMAVTSESPNDTLLVANSVSGTLSFVNPGTISSPLLGVSITPGNETIGVGGSVVLSASAQCRIINCPGTLSYAWSVSSSLDGFLNQSTGSTALFQSFNSTGQVNVTVNAHFGQYSQNSSAATIFVTRLTSVSFTPSHFRLGTGQDVILTPRSLCEPSTCPPSAVGLTWGGSGGNSTIESLPNGSAILVAGTVAGAIELSLVASMGATSVATSGLAMVVALVSVSIYPDIATLVPHQSVTLRSQLNCSSDPCLVGGAYSWILSNSTFGSLSSVNNSSTTLGVGSLAGEVTILLTVTLNGINRTASLSVSIRDASPANFLGLPGYDGYVLLGLVVAAVCATVVLTFRHKGKDSAQSHCGFRKHSS